MLSVTSQGPDDSVLLTTEAVLGTFNVPLGLGCLVFSLALGVFFFTRLLPGFSTRQVADGLDDGTLGRVELTSGLAITEDVGLISLVKQQCGC